MNSIKLTLTMPPSINWAYVNARGRGRVKSKEYVKWEIENENVNKEEWYRIIGDEWLEVNYTFYFPLYNKWNKEKKIKDLFNYEKCLTDFLTKKIEWFEDHKIKIWAIQKIDCAKESVDVVIKELIWI
jgi:Holliday junction resolvase RusA-like endonuclease